MKNAGKKRGERRKKPIGSYFNHDERTDPDLLDILEEHGSAWCLEGCGLLATKPYLLEFEKFINVTDYHTGYEGMTIDFDQAMIQGIKRLLRQPDCTVDSIRKWMAKIVQAKKLKRKLEKQHYIYLWNKQELEKKNKNNKRKENKNNMNTSSKRVRVE